MSIDAIRPPATVKPATATSLPCATTTAPAAPLTIAGRANGANGRPEVSTRRATASAPTSGGVAWDAYYAFGKRSRWAAEPNGVLASGSDIVDNVEGLERHFIPLLGSS